LSRLTKEDKTEGKEKIIEDLQKNKWNGQTTYDDRENKQFWKGHYDRIHDENKNYIPLTGPGQILFGKCNNTLLVCVFSSIIQ
jgi:hypothetical protein